MADTTLTPTGLLQIEVGASEDSWGGKLNDNAGLVNGLFADVGGAAALKVSNGGTGAVTASSARSALGVAIGADVQAYDADLTAFSALASNGLVVRTGAGTANVRALTGTANELTVTNGDGVSGDPTLSLPTALTFTGKTVTGGTFTNPTAITIDDDKFTIRDGGDQTRSVVFRLQNGAGTSRTMDLPSVDAFLVGRATTDTLTNKTLTSPIISGGTINNSPIGGTTPAAGTFTSLTATGSFAYNASSGSAIFNGPAGTIGTMYVVSGAGNPTDYIFGVYGDSPVGSGTRRFGVQRGGAVEVASALSVGGVLTASTSVATPSITLGGGTALSTYAEGTWTPTVTFATPGTSSISYATQTGRLTKIGRLVVLEFLIAFTPTVGTGSGVVIISGFPNGVGEATTLTGCVSSLDGFAAWPAGTSMVALVAPSSTTLVLRGIGGGVSGSLFTVSHLTNGGSHVIRGAVTYST